MSADLIGDYLAQLRAGLRTPPARTAEIVAEAEDHLRESAAAQRARGLGAEAAQRAAIAAFGPAKRVSRAHRPPVSAYAAAAGLKAWPLLGGYLLLSALLGGFLLGEEIATSHPRSLASVARDQDSQPGHQLRVSGLGGRPYPEQVAVVFGGCVLIAVLLLAGFLIARRRRRSSGLALGLLPRGLFPLAAAAGLLACWVAESRGASGYWLRRLPGVTGAGELTFGSEGAAVLLGAGCALWGLASLTGAPRAAPGTAASAAQRTTATRASTAPRYAAVVGLKAWQLLSCYLLLTALLSGILLYVDASTSSASRPGLGRWAALDIGCGLAGALLVAGFLALRRRHRRSGRQPAKLPRGLSLLISALGLLALAVAEYLFFGSDVNGMPAITDGMSGLLLGSQWAVVLLGAGCALQTLVILVRWAPARRPVPRIPSAAVSGD
jgi:hypothetical protein